MKIKNVFFTVAFSLISLSSSAASVYLSPATNDVVLNDVFSMDLVVDFAGDATLGGGVDLSYDSSKLNFQSFAFNGSLPFDSLSRYVVDPFGELSAIEFTTSNFETGIGGTGPTIIGRFSFSAVGLGDTNILLTEQGSVIGKTGPFVSAILFDVQNPVLTGARVSISAVPVPAAAWLMLSGIGGLLFTSRRKLS